MGDEFVVLAVFLQVPTQRRLELERFRFPALDQCGGIAVPTKVLVEKKVLQYLAERVIVGDALVKLEIGVDDLLNDRLDLVIEGKPPVLARIGPGGGIEAGVVGQLLHHLAERYLVLGAEVEAETLVQLGNYSRQRLQLLRRRGVPALCALRVENAGL